MFRACYIKTYGLDYIRSNFSYLENIEDNATKNGLKTLR